MAGNNGSHYYYLSIFPWNSGSCQISGFNDGNFQHSPALKSLGLDDRGLGIPPRPCLGNPQFQTCGYRQRHLEAGCAHSLRPNNQYLNHITPGFHLTVHSPNSIKATGKNLKLGGIHSLNSFCCFVSTHCMPGAVLGALQNSVPLLEKRKPHQNRTTSITHAQLT